MFRFMNWIGVPPARVLIAHMRPVCAVEVWGIVQCAIRLMQARKRTCCKSDHVCWGGTVGRYGITESGNADRGGCQTTQNTHTHFQHTVSLASC